MQAGVRGFSRRETVGAPAGRSWRGRWDRQAIATQAMTNSPKINKPEAEVGMRELLA
jgi:hypothetical protein